MGTKVKYLKQNSRLQSVNEYKYDDSQIWPVNQWTLQTIIDESWIICELLVWWGAKVTHYGILSE